MTGHLFVDNNGNGLQDLSEANLPDVTVVITDSLGVQLQVTTDNNGNYRATVAAGQVVVDVDEKSLPVGYQQTAGSDPTLASVPPGVTLDAGNDGYQPRGQVTGVIYLDLNSDGSYTVGIDVPFAGVDVEVVDRYGVTYSVVTDERGVYTATVPVGETTVDVVDNTLPSNSGLTTGSLDTATLVVPVSGIANHDVGYLSPFPTPVPVVVVAGHVWLDSDKNGQRDPAEPTVPGILVTLYDATTGAPVVLNGMPQTAVTGIDGTYVFDHLPPGDYYVVFDLQSLPPGYSVTQPDIGDNAIDSDADPATGRTENTGWLSEGQAVTALDMGLSAANTGLEDGGEPIEPSKVYLPVVSRSGFKDQSSGGKTIFYEREAVCIKYICLRP